MWDASWDGTPPTSAVDTNTSLVSLPWGGGMRPSTAP